MALTFDDLRAFVRRCDPFLALDVGKPNDEALYVDLDSGEAVRGEGSCIEALHRRIRFADRESCQLLTGFPGTGKTTELKRLAHRLANEKDLPTYPIYVDFEDYIDRYAPVSITDVLRVIAYCMDRAATEAEGEDPDQAPGYLKRFANFVLNSNAELKEVGIEAAGTSLMLEIKNNPSFRTQVDKALAGRFQRFADDARNVMSEAVTRLQKAQGVAAERVVVIADGLEKLTPLREDERERMESSVDTLFLTHRDFLHLPCHAIYTFPLWLRFRTASLGSNYGREPLVLPMVKVREPGGNPFGPGIEKMVETIARRLDVAAIFGPDPSSTLHPLIVASGGYLRDLLRMVRTLLTDTEQFPVTVPQVERVIRDLARSYDDTILESHLEILAHVHETHELPRKDNEQLGQFGTLLQRWLILAYRNGDEWYDLHPLVRRSAAVERYLAGR